MFDNNMLLVIGMSLMPVLGIGFTIFLLIYKVYICIRSRFDIRVNCWFCNHYTTVAYADANSWHCPSCEQYNGFTRDGDYNRPIYEQLYCNQSAENCSRIIHGSFEELNGGNSCTPTHNGFCDACNEAQRLKVEKLSQFEPSRDSRFDIELKAFKAQLEDQYRLCAKCDRHLQKVLREKKKMVLGSKLLAFIIKGAESIKQPHFNQLRSARHQHWRQRCRIWIGILTLVNIFCLYSLLPDLTRDYVVNLFGKNFGHYIFILLSHFITLIRVLVSYWQIFIQHPLMEKLILFVRTILMMVMYSMGLRWTTHLGLTVIYVESLCPFGILILSFVHKLVDGFCLSRYTLLLGVWSIIGGGLLDREIYKYTSEVTMLICSVLTFLLVYYNRLYGNGILQNKNDNSFHKIVSEDYLSDDDTVSMLSQQNSLRSINSNNSIQAAKPFYNMFNHSPYNSSHISMYNQSHEMLSSNSNFRSMYNGSNQILQRKFTNPRSVKASQFDSYQSNRSKSVACDLNTSVNYSSYHSCRESSYSEPLHQSHSDDMSFITAINNNFTYNQRPSFSQRHSSSGLQNSSLSLCNASLYRDSNLESNNLILPTRFSTMNLSANNCSSNTSYYMRDYFDNHSSSIANKKSYNRLIKCQLPTISSAVDGSLSRGSSQSSGFESQNDRNNKSRENSYGIDGYDMHQRTLTADNVNCFQTIDSRIDRNDWVEGIEEREIDQSKTCISLPTVITSAPFQNSNRVRSNSANFFNRSSTPLGSLLRDEDTFNLSKINDQLPNVNSDHLTNKWKDATLITQI